MEVWQQIAVAVTALGSVTAKAIHYLWKRNEAQHEQSQRQIADLQEKHRQCELHGKLLEAQIVILNSDMERKAAESDAIVVVDSNGLIREWSPGATLLFHCPQREALGKPMTIMIPARSQAQAKVAWDKLMASGRAPRRGPHYLIARTKNGDEIPVTMWYSGFESATGERMVGATVRFRSGLEPHDALQDGNSWEKGAPGAPPTN